MLVRVRFPYTGEVARGEVKEAAAKAAEHFNPQEKSDLLTGITSPEVQPSPEVQLEYELDDKTTNPRTPAFLEEKINELLKEHAPMPPTKVKVELIR